MPLIASRESQTRRCANQPPVLGPDAGVDLQVQMPVRIPGPGVVPHHCGLELLHRDLHLSAPAARCQESVGGRGTPRRARRALRD